MDIGAGKRADADQVAARLAGRQHGIFSRQQLLARGVSEAATDRRIRAGLWVVRLRGVYAHAGAPETDHQRAMAAHLACGGIPSHRLAASVWALPDVPFAWDVTLEPGRHLHPPGLLVHWSPLDQGDTCRYARVPVTTRDRTLIDLATVLEPDRYEVLLDECLGRRLVTWGRLGHALERKGRQGSRGAGRVAALLETRRGESRPVRSLQRRIVNAVVACGVPPPIVEYEVRLPGGEVRFIDGAWMPEMVGLEVNSYERHSTFTDWASDNTRNRGLAALGWHIIPATARDLDNPMLLAGQILIALGRRRVSAGGA